MKMWQRVLLVLVSALLASFVFAPFGVEKLALVAWIPLLFALRGASVRAGVWLGFAHGVLFYGNTMSWIADVFGSWQMLPPLVVIMSLFSLVFGAGFAFASKHYEGKWLLALFAGFWWLAVEFVRSEIYALQFPWMTPGVGLGPSLLSPMFGVYSMSFVIIVSGALCLQKGRQLLIGGFGLIIALLAAELRPEAKIENRSVRVLAVQAENVMAEELLDRARVAAKAESELDAVLFPEYSITYDIRKNKLMWQELQDFSKELGAIGVVGTQTDIAAEEYYNTALSFDANGELGEHYKNHTVHFFADGKKGTQAEAVQTPIGRIGTPICFDSDYEDVARRMTADGAEYFLCPSLDATRWGVKQHLQHAELFRHRAAENGRWMMIAAGSGMTQLIDNYGNRVSQLPIMEEGTLVGELQPLTNLTFYTRYGWLFPWVGMCIAGGWILGLVYCRSKVVSC